MNDDNGRIPPSIIASAIQMVEGTLSRNSDNRSKNRNLAIVVVGAITGLAFKEESVRNTLLLAIAAVVAAFMFWYQDYQFHKWRHGWDGMRKRIRRYICGEIDEDELAVLTYVRSDEKKARLFSKSSSFTFLVLIAGAMLVGVFKYVSLTE